MDLMLINIAQTAAAGKLDLQQLRSFQDWTLRYWLQGVDGVAEVASIGGFVKQYQADLDPAKLQSYGVSIRDVADAIRRSNGDVGGGVIEIAEHENYVRGRGYIKSVADVEQAEAFAADGDHVEPA